MKIINADCIEAMKEMPENSVDSIVTDPPYELGFMGKSWDSTGIAFQVAVWSEALRVLKPGGHLIAFSGSRTYHRMAVAIEDAGFEIRDQIMWVYGSGFPKSMDISKAIDKSDAAIARRERDLKFTEWMRLTGLKARQIDDITQSNMGGHYLTDKEQPTVATAEMFDKLRPHLPEVPEWVEQMVRERTIESENYKNREITGEYKNAAPAQIWMDNYDLPADLTIKDRKDLAFSPAAQQWQGWGTALKPAHEPMVLARKPVVSTVANNVLTYGVGGLNIDGSRVGDDLIERGREGRTKTGGDIYGSGFTPLAMEPVTGRFPANFIHDGSDEVVGLFPDTGKSGVAVNRNRTGKKPNEVYEGGWWNLSEDVGFDDSGSAARFFYCAKTSKRDRNEGLEGFEAKRDHDGRAEGKVGGDNPRNRTNAAKVNHHPTVKPTSLMQYLVRLVTPQGGVVLDPFMGSGSTGKACAYEGFDFIGIDQSAEYVEIAKARINFALENKDADI